MVDDPCRQLGWPRAGERELSERESAKRFPSQTAGQALFTLIWGRLVKFQCAALIETLHSLAAIGITRQAHAFKLLTPGSPAPAFTPKLRNTPATLVALSGD
ncbi:hypothetical protein [Uliginosibacterium flavum]|uniref:DUF4372 domain-containing protein n=1 Tax=Uliginosibacterium flavum TaxID=1396831 RepID=A0ABV2TPV7_9RHOO